MIDEHTYLARNQITMKAVEAMEDNVLGEITYIAKKIGEDIELVVNKEYIRQLLYKAKKTKVLYRNKHTGNYDMYNQDIYTCPACGRRLRNKQRDPYCGKCGQHLDWGDKESED